MAETDEDLTMKYLEGEEISNDELRAALRRATIEGKLVPVLCGSALKNKGVQAMLDAVVAYLPSPLEIPAPIAMSLKTDEERDLIVSDDGQFVALAFKIVADPFVGRLTLLPCLFRHALERLLRLQRDEGQKERIGRLLQMHANHREDIDTIYSGDICAAVGLKNTFTGDTLCDAGPSGLLENIVFPTPVIADRHRAEDQAPTRTRWASRSSAWPKRIRPSASIPTRTRARRSSRAWASCIWM